LRAFVATAEPGDAEMEERIRRHKLQRGDGWETVEEPLRLAEAIGGLPGRSVILVDCLTLWLSNLIKAGLDEAALGREFARFASCARDARVRVIAVTNEVGQGIVPEGALARRFRDLSGIMNQTAASAADEVYLVSAGIPLKLKATSKNSSFF
jgi:adenosylcobinamide kinase/adenosylcobinamide-phosphate guanylyltransferase